jgi:hypothetical protein
MRRFWLSLASAVGLAAAAVGRAATGLLGLGLVAVGCWLAWPPAGFIVAGALLLADRVASQLVAGRGER